MAAAVAAAPMELDDPPAGQVRELNDQVPWVEKYRPSELDEILSHKDIITTISQLIDSNRMPHLLFYGPPGTGKTSTILACAKKLNGPQYKNMVLELNASDDRGIDVVREQIKSFASSRKLFSSGQKLIILDEADSMTSAAQAALRRVIEKYTKTTRFCLICNYVNKIIPALQSRCTRFRFGPLPKEAVVDKLREVARLEKVNLTEDGLQAVIRLSEGDMRKCLNVLQACHSSFDVVDETNVYLCTGNPLPADITYILHLLNNEPFDKAYQLLRKLQQDKGLSLVDVLTFLHELVLRVQYPPEIMTFALSQMANIEYNLSFGGPEAPQLLGLVGVFQIVQHMSVEHARAVEQDESKQ